MSKVKINLKSKTHSFGVILGILGGVLTFLPSAREFIPEDMYGGLFMFVSVVTIVLRNMTTKPVDEK